jgi:hypothetical protein
MPQNKKLHKDIRCLSLKAGLEKKEDALEGAKLC